MFGSQVHHCASSGFVEGLKLLLSRGAAADTRCAEGVLAASLTTCEEMRALLSEAIEAAAAAAGSGGSEHVPIRPAAPPAMRVLLATSSSPGRPHAASAGDYSPAVHTPLSPRDRADGDGMEEPSSAAGRDPAPGSTPPQEGTMALFKRRLGEGLHRHRRTKSSEETFKFPSEVEGSADAGDYHATHSASLATSSVTRTEADRHEKPHTNLEADVKHSLNKLVARGAFGAESISSKLEKKYKKLARAKEASSTPTESASAKEAPDYASSASAML